MTHQEPKDFEKLQISVLLNEYQACHANKNHFDTIRWTIGSIFIGTSLTLFGLSFGRQLSEVLLAFIFSMVLMLVWYLYYQHVNPYVMVSILRCHEIEKKLGSMKLEIRLHASIHEKEQKIPRLKGIWITFLLFSSVVGIWLLRIALLEPLNYYAHDLALLFLGFLIGFWWVHFCNFNPKIWNEEFNRISKEAKGKEGSV